VEGKAFEMGLGIRWGLGMDRFYIFLVSQLFACISQPATLPSVAFLGNETTENKIQSFLFFSLLF
jgi:hypothetical protein